MSNKITVAAGIGVGLLAAGIYLYTGSSSVATVSDSEEVQESATVPSSSKTMGMSGQNTVAAVAPTDLSGEYQYVQDRLEIMRERRPGVDYDPNEVAAAMARTDAWTPLSSPPTGLPLSPAELTDGREFIDLDSLKIETLVPGDTMKLAIGATDQEYDVKIDTVEKLDESRLTFSGHIDGYDGQSYFVSMSKGQVLTMGGVDTPDGHFTIQAHGNKGWVASSGALFKEHVDPILPPGADGQAVDGHSHDGHDHSH